MTRVNCQAWDQFPPAIDVMNGCGAECTLKQAVKPSMSAQGAAMT